MSHLQDFEKTSIVVYHGFENSQENYLWEVLFLTGAVPKVMSATLNVVVSINSTTVMQSYWTTPICECFYQPLSFLLPSRDFVIKQFFLQNQFYV